MNGDGDRSGAPDGNAGADERGDASTDTGEPTEAPFDASFWATTWSVADPDGPLHAVRWATIYLAVLSFVVPFGMLLAGIASLYAYAWLLYWWPWTLFAIVGTWAVDNVVVYRRERRSK